MRPAKESPADVPEATVTRYCARPGCEADISSRAPQARYCSSPCRQAGYRSRGGPAIKGQPAVIPFEVLSLSDLAVRLYGWISARYDGLLYATPPSAGTLARELGRPRGTIMQAIAELEREGWLSASRARGGQKRYALCRWPAAHRKEGSRRLRPVVPAGTGSFTITPPLRFFQPATASE